MTKKVIFEAKAIIDALESIAGKEIEIADAVVKLRGAAQDEIFNKGGRWADMYKTTTRFSHDVEWPRVKRIVASTLQNAEMKRVYLLTPAEFKKEKEKLTAKGKDDELKALKKIREKGITRVGDKMVDFADGLLSRDSKAEQARVKKARKEAKEAREAKAKEAKEAKEAKVKEAKGAKTGKDKIKAQLATIELIIQGDEDPSYPVDVLIKTLSKVVAILDSKA